MPESKLEFMMAEREQLLNVLYESAPEIPAWERFLKVARTVFSCDGVSLVIGLPSDGQTEPLTVHDDDTQASIADTLCNSGYCDTLPFDEVASICPPSHDDRGGLGQALILPVAAHHGKTASLILWRAPGSRAFDDPAKDLFRSLAAPLKRSLNVFYRVVDLERRKVMYDAALETSSIGAILVDREGKVLLTNSIADAFLAAEDGLHLVHGKLRAATPHQTANLIEQIQNQALEQSARPDWRVYAPIALARAGQILPLTVIVRPGPAFHPFKQPLRRTAMLILRDPGRQQNIPATTLARLFGLSPAESLLASELAAGASLEEAASHIGISRHTVRSQLQSIFMKTGTNRQGELVHVLLSSAATSS